jgi:hypothetical protein
MLRLRILLLVLLAAALRASADTWQTVPGDAVAQAAERFAQASLGVGAVHSVRAIPPRRLPAGRVAIEGRWLGAAPSGDLAGRRLVVPVMLTVDGRLRETVGVLVEIGSAPPRPSTSAEPTRRSPQPSAQPSVRPGDHLTVTCLSGSGQLRIEVDGVARDRGNVGDAIRIQVSHRLLEARITGPGQAEVRL